MKTLRVDRMQVFETRNLIPLRNILALRVEVRDSIPDVGTLRPTNDPRVLLTIEVT